MRISDWSSDVCSSDLPIVIPCDSRQLRQALTNLLQNAVDAIEGRRQDEGDALPDDWAGEVEVAVTRLGPRVCVTVADNGRGLPESARHRLTEPDVTTRDTGTGRGLAIVQPKSERPEERQNEA